MSERSFSRKIVQAEIKSILETGRRRILDLGGDCDPVGRMLKDTMHMLDKRAEQERRP